MSGAPRALWEFFSAIACAHGRRVAVLTGGPAPTATQPLDLLSRGSVRLTAGPPAAGTRRVTRSARQDRTRRRNHSRSGDPSGSRFNLRLAVPVEVVALRAA